ncbi:hypothetical protein G432_17490 [Sphingomonas sp. MM-1]|nr:hypothetical protein G432_17490 [Sphingomonas sp. MM-1]
MPVTRYDRRTWLLAACLSALAGFVDAVGFLKLGGFFVSFMSGNTTRLGVGLFNHGRDAAIAAGLLGLFVAGVVLGASVGRLADPDRRPALLALMAMLLGTAAGAAMAGADRIAVVLMAVAMGSENAMFERDGEIHIGLTYMTGTLVKMGQRIAAACFGGDRLGWLPYALLWTGLALGACAGAAIYPLLGLHALWIAAGVSAILAIVTLAARREARAA